MHGMQEVMGRIQKHGPGGIEGRTVPGHTNGAKRGPIMITRTLRSGSGCSSVGIAQGVDVGFVMPQQGGAQVVGNIGMYYAAYRLSQQGWNVMPTARNARGVRPPRI